MASKRMGRPPKPAAERRDEHVGVRLTGEERGALERAAEQSGRPLSDYVREAAIEYATKRRRKRRGDSTR